MNRPPVNVMVAGIGGASLGTEIGKCLRLAGGYRIFGCDLSPSAYGLYDSIFHETYRIGREDYVAQVIHACRQAEARWLIPGGEQPMILLGHASDALQKEGVCLVGNAPGLIAAFSDKESTFRKLAQAGIEIPRTRVLAGAEDLREIGMPCIVKPATGTGGSASVFYAVSIEEALLYAEFIRRNGSTPLAQEYIGAEEGEFTIGVLSLPDGSVAGSIALRRALDAKLSVAYRGRGGLISSGYSQGRIDAFPELCRQAEAVALAIGSRGPINVQGRVRNGRLLPFEINPRFSASTYLRALAGFNEIDVFLRFLMSGERLAAGPVKPGWYLRSLTETVVPDGGMK